MGAEWHHPRAFVFSVEIPAGMRFAGMFGSGVPFEEEIECRGLLDKTKYNPGGEIIFSLSPKVVSDQ